jgi:hypothetical protein
VQVHEVLRACLDPIYLQTPETAADTKAAGRYLGNLFSQELYLARPSYVLTLQSEVSGLSKTSSCWCNVSVCAEGTLDSVDNGCQCPSCCWALEFAGDAQLACRIPPKETPAHLDKATGQSAVASSGAPSMTCIAEEVAHPPLCVSSSCGSNDISCEVLRASTAVHGMGPF